MPKYIYRGKEVFVDNDYEIKVYPNEILVTEYVLPLKWKDFQLIDLNTPTPLLPKTEVITVDSEKRIDLRKYTTIVFVLRNSDTASLEIKCKNNVAPSVVLDNVVNYWYISNDTYYDYFDVMFLSPLNGIPEVTVYYGFEGSIYGSQGEGSGSGGNGGCTISVADPVPVTHGGLSAGTVIGGWDPCQVLERILFPYQYPSFTSFYIQGQTTSLEVGDVISGGVRSFRWSTNHNNNITPNTISINDITNSNGLISNTVNDGAEDLNIGADKSRTSVGNYTWRISGQNTNGGTFHRDFTVTWYYRMFWGYSSQSSLTGADILSLQHSALRNGYSGNYNFTNPGSAVYYYIVYPDAWSLYSDWRDVATGFAVDGGQQGVVNVTNSFGVIIPYKVIRTTYLQNGNLNSSMS